MGNSSVVTTATTWQEKRYTTLNIERRIMVRSLALFIEGGLMMNKIQGLFGIDGLMKCA